MSHSFWLKSTISNELRRRELCNGAFYGDGSLKSNENGRGGGAKANNNGI